MFDFNYSDNSDGTVTGFIRLGGISIVAVTAHGTREGIKQRLKRKLAEKLNRAFIKTDLFK